MHASRHSTSRTASRAGALLPVLLLVVSTSCHDAPTGVSAIPNSTVTIVTGNAQAGEAGVTLSVPLRVRVVDRNGAGVEHVTVHWIVDGDDEVDPRMSLTDGNGEAETRWTPRAPGPTRTLRARVGMQEVTFHATVAGSPPPEPGPLALVELTTFDGSGQVVHPDVAEVSWLGAAPMRVLAVTPYPFGDAMQENPSVYFGGQRNVDWVVPDGAANPVALPVEGHLSDPDIVDDPQARELRLYYRGAGAGNTLWLTTSRDGRRWSAGRVLLTTPSHEMVSPSIVRRSANRWEMWSVNAGSAGCSAYSTMVELRTSTDGTTWSAPQRVTMGAANHQVWHLDVQFVPALAQYVAVYSVKTHTDCTTAAMFVATSTDGVTWTARTQPLLVRGVIPAFSHIVYRSTFLFDAASNEFTFWHSGASYSDGQWTWRMATERRRREDVLSPRMRYVQSSGLVGGPRLTVAP